MVCWILALPMLLFIICLVSFALACFKRWQWAPGVLILALAVNWYGEIFALHPFGGYASGVRMKEVKVMEFNVHGTGEDFDQRINGILKLIEGEDPDVLFISEMFTQYKHYDVELDSVLRRSFPYSTYEGQTQWGNVFYSKYPIVSKIVLSITLGQSQPLITIVVGNDRLMLLGTHLSSNNYVDPKTKIEVDSVTNKGAAKQYLKTIEKGYSLRRQDVDSICLQLADVDTRHMFILGDMNDVGGSYTIRKLESLGLKDSWCTGGFGFGGTRKVLGFPFRIDHIMYGSGFELKGVKVVESDGLSDHEALVASFGIN